MHACAYMQYMLFVPSMELPGDACASGSGMGWILLGQMLLPYTKTPFAAQVVLAA